MPCIYVIELDKSVLKRKKFLKANPDYIEGKDCFYVGYSSKTPELRFEQHISAYRNSKGKRLFSNIVRDFGVKLRPFYYKHINATKITNVPEAQFWEKEKARLLRKKGFGVWQN
tara:strand:+ start:212 stop:553 length:342 start_codon:yes stop_codon:yes gene_type:complete